MDLNDKIGSVGVADLETYNLFTVKIGPSRLYDFNDNTQLAVTYELNRDLKIIRRKVYGILDCLGDIGGLAGALVALFTAGITIFQYKAAVGYVSNHTILIEDGQEREKGEF